MAELFEKGYMQRPSHQQKKSSLLALGLMLFGVTGLLLGPTYLILAFLKQRDIEKDASLPRLNTSDCIVGTMVCFEGRVHHDTVTLLSDWVVWEETDKFRHGSSREAPTVVLKTHRTDKLMVGVKNGVVVTVSGSYRLACLPKPKGTPNVTGVLRQNDPVFCTGEVTHVQEGAILIQGHTVAYGTKASFVKQMTTRLLWGKWSGAIGLIAGLLFLIARGSLQRNRERKGSRT